MRAVSCFPMPTWCMPYWASKEKKGSHFRYLWLVNVEVTYNLFYFFIKERLFCDIYQFFNNATPINCVIIFTFLWLIVGGRSNCKFWEKTPPQIHLVIIREWPKNNSSVLISLDNSPTSSFYSTPPLYN